MIYVDYDFFFFNDTATTEIYTLSLHDALPISYCKSVDVMLNGEYKGNYQLSDQVEVNKKRVAIETMAPEDIAGDALTGGDRKSTRLNSSHANISYAVFCLKKKNNNTEASIYTT